MDRLALNSLKALAVALGLTLSATSSATPSDESAMRHEPWFRITYDATGAPPQLAFATSDISHLGRYWTIAHLNGLRNLDALAEIETEFRVGSADPEGSAVTIDPYASLRFYPDRVEACECYPSEDPRRAIAEHPLPVADFAEAFSTFHDAMKEWTRVNRDLIEAIRQANRDRDRANDPPRPSRQ